MVFCSECKNYIGCFDNLPLMLGIDEPMKNKNQPYSYAIFKDRDEHALTYYYIKAFCKKECKKKFLKRYYKEEGNMEELK